jgi:plasmid maintenance system antidote protein VapI
MMTAKDFEEIERSTGRLVPRHFKEFILTLDKREVGAQLREWDKECGGHAYLLYRAERLIQENARVRSVDIDQVRWVPPDGRWPDHFVIFGETGEGEYFCLNTEDQIDLGVWQYYLHGDGEFRCAYKDFDSWLTVWSERIRAELIGIKTRNVRRTPKHPGIILQSLLQVPGATEAELQRILGIDVETLRRLFAGEIDFTPEIEKRVAVVNSVFAIQLGSIQRDYDAWLQSQIKTMSVD